MAGKTKVPTAKDPLKWSTRRPRSGNPKECYYCSTDCKGENTSADVSRHLSKPSSAVGTSTRQAVTRSVTRSLTSRSWKFSPGRKSKSTKIREENASFKGSKTTSSKSPRRKISKLLENGPKANIKKENQTPTRSYSNDSSLKKRKRKESDSSPDVLRTKKKVSLLESPLSPANCSLENSILSPGNASLSKEEKFEGVEFETAAAVHRAFRRDLITPSFMNPLHLAHCRGATVCNEKNHDEAHENENISHVISSATSRSWPLLLNHLGACAMNPQEYLPVKVLKCVMYGIIEDAPLSLAESFRDVLRRYFVLHPPCRTHMATYYSEFLFSEAPKNLPYRDKLVYNLPKLIKMITSTLAEMRSEAVLLPDGSIKGAKTKSPKSKYVKDWADLSQYFSESMSGQEDCKGVSPTFSKKLLRNQDYQSKLRRYFLGYELFVELLETDFFSWLVKYRHKIVISNIDSWSRKHWPLIMLGTWKKGGEIIGEVNNQCKVIINLYTLCPPAFRHSVQRHLCLIAEVARIHESNPDKKHPFISKLCFGFAKEVANAIQKDDYTSERKIALLNELEPPWLRMCVASHILHLELPLSGVITLNHIILYVHSQLISSSSASKTSPSIDSSQKTPSVKQDATPLRSSKGKSKREDKFKIANKFGESDLHIFCRKNAVGKVQMILDNDKIDVNIEDNNGWRPIHEAVKHGSIGCVQLLIKEKLPPKGNLDIRSGNWEGVTPLMDAVDADHVGIVKILLKHKVATTMYQKNKKGLSAFDLASEEVKKYLLEAYEREILTLNRLAMSKFEVLVLEQLIFSYISTYKVNQPGFATDLEIQRPDPVYKFQYGLYNQNLKDLEKLLALISRLATNRLNPAHLKFIELGLKCLTF